MRTNNGKVKNIIISVYFILIVLAIFFATVFSAFKDLTPNPFLSFLIVVAVFAVLLITVHFVSRYFEYDSDGYKVVVLNRGLLLADHFNYREKKLEFKKEQLIKFKFRNYFIYKTLELTVRNGNGNSGNRKREKFNVTLVPKKKRKYIKQSLSKIIKHNRKLNTE